MSLMGTRPGAARFRAALSQSQVRGGKRTRPWLRVYGKETESGEILPRGFYRHVLGVRDDDMAEPRRGQAPRIVISKF